MDVPASDATRLRALLAHRPGDEDGVEHTRAVAEVVRAIAAAPSDDPDREAALDEAAAWLALALDDAATAEPARAALTALGPRAAAAVLARLSPAGSKDELVAGVRAIERLTADASGAAALAPALVPPLATLLAVRREAAILRCLGALLARLAAHVPDGDAARARVRAAALRALDGDRADRRDAALAVIAALGSSADALAERLRDELGRTPAAGLALGALSPARAWPLVAEALEADDPDVVFGALRAVEAAAARDRLSAAAAFTDACVRRLHDPRPRVGDQASLSLLVLGPPLRALTIWTTAVVEREAAWIFSLPFRAGELGDDLFEALFALAIEPDTPASVRLKVRALLYALASRVEHPHPRARAYWERLEGTR